MNRVIKLIPKRLNKLLYKKGLLEYDIKFLKSVNTDGDLNKRITELENYLSEVCDNISKLTTNTK